MMRPIKSGYCKPEGKTIRIEDNGLGMTEDEVDEYINQIAFPVRRIS